MEVANAGDVASANTALYFDSIPADVLSNVVRFFSPRPNAIDWARFLSPKEAIVVASAGDSLRCAAAKALKCVRSGNLYDKCAGCNLSLLSYRTCRCLGTGELALFSSEDPQYFSFIINHYDAPFVQLISYLGEHVPQLDFPSGQVVTELKAAAIIRYCSAMDELDVYDPVETNLMRSIIQHRGSQLNKLKCNWDLIDVIPTIAHHCVKLRELSLRSEDNLSSILGAVGDRLTALEVRKYINEASYETIRNTCHHLQTIRVFCHPELYDVLIDFYRSYGAQLELASFFSFNAVQCRRVLEACTKVEVASIDLAAEGDGDGHAVFSALQKCKVHEAIVDYEIVLKDEHHLSEALSGCANILALNLFGRSCEEDDGVNLKTLRLPMPNLEEFSTGYMRPKEIVELAKSTRSLTTLRMFVDFDEESHQEIWEALRSVVLSNPRLKQVKIHLLNFWCMGYSNAEGDDNNDEGDDEDEDDGGMWDDEEQRYIPPAPRAQRVPDDEIPLGVSDGEGETFLYYLIGAFQKAHELRELIIVSYPNVNEYWDYMYCVEDACHRFGLRHRRLSLAVLGVDYLPLEVYHEEVEEDEEAGEMSGEP